MGIEIRNTTSNNSNWQDKHKILLNSTTTEVSKRSYNTTPAKYIY